MLRHVFAALLVAVATTAVRADDSASLSDMDYRLGTGLKIPGTGITLGGYATATFDQLRHQAGRLSLDDTSLSVWWEGAGRWKLFAEFDYENSISSRSPQSEDDDRYLALERFYVDYAVSELATVRVGKFLTPIGRWNLLHATPLVWTTSRPMVTTEAFPTNVTGLMVSGSVPVSANGIDYMVYASNGSELRPNPALDTFNEAVGVRVTASLSIGSQIGLSYASFEQDRTQDVRKHLLGVDFLWTGHGIELSGEALYRSTSSASVGNDRGAFIQAVVPAGDRLSVVARYETYRRAQQVRSTVLLVGGISYRLTPAVVVKAEWVSGQHNDFNVPQGFLSSISVLF